MGHRDVIRLQPQLSIFLSPSRDILWGADRKTREEGIEKERKINNSKQSYIYLKLCGQQARVSGRVCFISKGLIEKKKKNKKNLDRGFNPSVGKVKQEQDHQQQQ